MKEEGRGELQEMHRVQACKGEGKATVVGWLSVAQLQSQQGERRARPCLSGLLTREWTQPGSDMKKVTIKPE